MHRQVFRVSLTFTEPLLGSSPRNKDVYATFIDTKRPKDVADENEAENVAEREERGWTGFLREPDVYERDAPPPRSNGLGKPAAPPAGERGALVRRGRLFVYDYTFKGFLKENGAALRETGEHDLAALKRKIGQHVAIEPRRVFPFAPEGHDAGPVANGGCGCGRKGETCKHYHVEDDVLERPLRAETMQGPRVTLARSDLLQPGATMTFDLVSLWPAVLDEAFFRACFARGEWTGYGQWRTASFGRFTFTLEDKGTFGAPPPKREAKPRGRPKKAAPASAEAVGATA